ncbi:MULTISPECIES: D-alanine--D-alanine ligase [Sutcliffiella]|uniref:D-alanine--D-alanine ligase n=1 Tax=Sutcliffiella cohnii TaxID=33932 RepID=A0A223KXE7_9BACI|nr:MULTISPECIES: D-alanine--D-alanine ligase [Sutcliffiella]AST94119.1 D-alanine--D-alanine ligase A [Sutcliffiella cohnii]WBL15332.1 D-alanine--D-alanine ligase [Sutcliffiella sp. NC1]
MKTTLHLLYGGKSAEHKVSLQTALAVTKALNKDKFNVFPLFITEEGQWVRGKQLTGEVESVAQLQLTDKGTSIAPLALTEVNEQTDDKPVIFPLLHGPNGEDGTVQGMLELLNLPYVGNGVLASSAGMDKVIMKQLFAQAGLPQVGYVHFLRSEWEKNDELAYKKVEEELGYPVFVKPANLGSSVGINKAKNREELASAFKEAFDFDRKIIVEQGLENAREIEIGVLGNDEPQCSVLGEIVPKKEFYDYKAKYEDGNTAMIIPAEVDEQTYESVKEMAIKAFKAIDASGLVRADFFLTRDGELYINEVNTMPGFTPYSMFPLLWQHTGVAYPELIERLVQLAKDRHDEKQKIKFTF